MFFVKINNGINLRGAKQELYNEMKKRYDIEYGIHCVVNGYVQGPGGQAQYWEFQEIMEKLPTYKGVVKSDAPKCTVMDIYWPDGLLMQSAMEMEVLEKMEMGVLGKNALCDFYESKGRGYLCLCKNGDYYFQVIVA